MVVGVAGIINNVAFKINVTFKALAYVIEIWGLFFFCLAGVFLIADPDLENKTFCQTQKCCSTPKRRSKKKKHEKLSSSRIGQHFLLVCENL
jgi:hypothetical protein